MTNSTITTQLTELAVKITTEVAQMLSHASKDLEPAKRRDIDQMIQENLPDVVVNTLFKTPSLHSTQGVDHLRENISTYAHQIAQRIIRNS